MRCPHCSGEIPSGSHFCGICGNHIAEGPRPSVPPSPPSLPPGPAASSPSLFELPAARGPRLARIFVLVTLNLILAGAGAAMIASYVAKRAEAVERAAPVSRDEPEPDPATTRSSGAAAPETPPAAGDKVLATSVASTGEPAASSKSDSPADKARRPTRPEPRTGVDPLAGAGAGASGATAEADPEAQTKAYAARIDALASRNQRQLHGCYQGAAKSAPADKALEGRVDIRFRIMPDGRAAGGRAVANTTGSEALASCLVGVVEGWSFPPGATKPLDFVWPFRFRSRSQ